MWDEFVYGLRKVRNDRLSSFLFVLLLTIGISTSAVVGGLLNSALGALPWQIARTVYWQIVVAVSAGLILGAAVSALLVRFAAGLLYAVNALDPVSFGGAIGLVAIGALAAGVQPTWRLSRIEPLLVLREE